MSKEILPFYTTTEEMKESSPGAVESVIIIGSNISGAITAYCLAENGMGSVLLLDSQNILDVTRPSCTGCGGLLREQTVEFLKSVGITIPDQVIRQELQGYAVHLPNGEIIEVPVPMISVYRGHGPLIGEKKPGFDAFLLQQAIDAGANFERELVTGVQLRESGKAVVETYSGRELEADMVVGAFGHNGRLVENIELRSGERLDAPETQRAAVFELFVGEEFCQETYGDKAHVVTVPRPLARGIGVWFAAFIPKGEGMVSVVLMGREDLRKDDPAKFFNSPFTVGLLPEGIRKDNLWTRSIYDGGARSCACKSTMTSRQPKNIIVPGPGGMLLVGDAGRTRWGKAGIEAGLRTGLAAAQAILDGDLGAYQQFVDLNYPENDPQWAHVLMILNDLMISFPGVGHSLYTLHNREDSLPSQIIEAYLRPLLTGETPYQKILPEVMREAVSLAFNS